MVNKKVVMFLFLVLISTNLLFAQGCADEGWKGYSKIHNNKTISITCPTCDYINFSITNPNQEVFLDNVGMTKNGSIFYYTFLGSDLNNVGTYQLDGYSNLDLPLALCFDVSISGNEPSIGSYSILLFLCLLFFILLIWLNIKFDENKRKQLYKKIVEGYFKNKNYDEKNLGKVIIFTFLYGIMKNFFVFYYLIIVFFLFVLTELLESYGIKSMILLSTTILNIFLWGFILIFIIFAFSLFQIVINLMKDVSDSYMGVFDEGKN